MTYEFDANPHFPVGKFDVLTGIQRMAVVQDGTNVLKTLKLPIREGERFGFAVEKESWPMIDSVVIRNKDGKVVFRDDFDGSLDGWEFTRTRAYIADGVKRDRLVWSGDLWWAERNIFHAFAPTDNNVGWPGNLKVEVSDRPGRWTLVRAFETLPRQQTDIDLSTVVGATRGRYIRLSSTKLGPAWLVNNFNLQFGKVKVLFE